MERAPWKIYLSKDAHKFSSAHMTLFPDGTKEPLHGHNYRVEFTAELREADFGEMVPFSVLKRIIAGVCAELDEKILFPLENALVTFRDVAGETEILACGKRYVFPSDEVVGLPVQNISVELLAREVTLRFNRRLEDTDELSRDAKALLAAVEIKIEETTGQAASYYLKRS